jgi:D-glycero-D-manno-heptose 1,7-bisphosphate phosphatase
LPGLFEQIGDRFNMDLAQVAAVGDSLRDAQAAAAAGCKPHLVLTGKGEQFRGMALPPSFPVGTLVHENLMAFADFLLANDKMTHKK